MPACTSSPAGLSEPVAQAGNAVGPGVILALVALAVATVLLAPDEVLVERRRREL